MNLTELYSMRAKRVNITREMCMKSRSFISILLAGVCVMLFNQAQAVQVGQKAPNFTLKDETGKLRSLSDMAGHKMVIYFYPKDDTPGCTKQACSIRDGFADLNQAGITVWGISYDSPESHKKFKEKYTLPFTLLSDYHKEVSKQYGVSGWFFPDRVTFLINQDGTIIDILKDINVREHAQQIITAFNK